VKELGTNQTGNPSLNVDLAVTDDVSIIRVSGSLVGKEVAIFRRACAEAQKDGLTHRVVDLSEVDEIDGYGIAGLVGLLARRRKERGMVVLCGVNPDLRLMLEATHCDTVFKMAVSTSGALELLKDSNS
jgi:anti-anti-sigma factor